MKLPKPNIIKPIALLIPLLLAAGNAHATNYACDEAFDGDGITYNQILTPDPILASERPFLTEAKVAWMQEKIERDDVHARRFVTLGNQFFEAGKGQPATGISNALMYRLDKDKNTGYLEWASAQYKRRYVDDNERNGGLVMGYEEGCNPNSFRAYGKYLPMHYMWLYDEMTEEERAHAVRTMAYIGEYWLKYIPGNNTPWKNSGKAQRVDDSDETVMIADNLLWYGLALRGTELSDRLIAMSDFYFEEHVVPKYINGHFKGGIWGEGIQYDVQTNQHWAINYMLNKQYRPEKLAEYKAKGWDFDKFFNDAIEGYIYITVGDNVQSRTHGSNQNTRKWVVNEEKTLPDMYRSMMTFAAATSSERHKKLANGWAEDLKDRVGATRKMNNGVWHMLFEEPELGTFSAQTGDLPTTFKADGPNTLHSRTGWGADASSFYMSARARGIDHAQADQLSFDYFRKGQKMSGEKYGYNEVIATTIGHNLLQIENPENFITGKDADGNPLPAFSGYLTGGRCYGCAVNDPVGEGEMLYLADALNYNYMALDATLLYNDRKILAGLPQYIDHVSRQVVNIKPDAFVVFDRVVTDKSNYGDFVHTSDALRHYNLIDENGDYLRKIEYQQLFRSEPIEDENGFLVSQVYDTIAAPSTFDELDNEIHHTQTLKQQLKFKSLLPVNPTIELLDDSKQHWAAFVEKEQQGWTMRVAPQERQEDVTFMSTFYGGDEGAVVTPTQEVVMTKENGLVKSFSADMTGAALEINGEWHIIMFPDRPDFAVSNVSYDVSFIPEGAVIHHYVNGVSGDNYFYSESNGSFSFGSASGTPIVNNAGSLYQRTQDGVAYEEFEAPSAPTGFVLNDFKTNSTEITFSWTPADDNVAVTSYDVYRGTGDVPYITVKSPELIDTGLTPSTNYTYTVVAKDLDGNESAPSEPFTVKSLYAHYEPPIAGAWAKEANRHPLPKVHPEIKVERIAKDELTAWPEFYKGVYPVSGSVDVDPSEQIVMMEFTDPFSFIYSHGKFFITNLDTGEVVYTFISEHGADDDQGGFRTRRFALDLPAGTLEPDTNYGVTTETRFAGFQAEPWKMNKPLLEGVWTFKTGAAFTPLAIEGTTPEMLITRGDFEALDENGESVPSLFNFDHRTSGTVTNVNPIAGSYSQELALQSWGRARFDYVYPWGTEVHAKALQGYSQVRLPEAGIENGTLNFCVVAYFSGSSERKDIVCEAVIGEPGEVVKVEPVLNLDPAANVERMYAWYQYIGSESTVNVTVDDLNLVLHRTNAE